MVVGPTVEEQILDDITQTLLGIQGAPLFENVVYAVHQATTNAMELPARPAIVMIPGDSDESDDRLGMIQVWLPITLVLVMDVYDETWPAKVRSFVADVKAALREDWTRGGLAVTTRVRASEIWASESTEPIAGARVDFEVYFRHLIHDPTAPI